MRGARALASGVFSSAALAVSFLTVLPVAPRGPTAPSRVESSVAWFPLVGALIGALAGGVRVAAEPLLGAGVASVLALIALVGVTGALHQDGLADTADGLGVHGDRERRLEAMRDSAVGAFGMLALLAWALLFFSTLASLSDTHALQALIAACALARWSALLHARAIPAARPDGLGAAFAPTPAALWIATALAILVAGLSCGLLPGLAAIGAALLAAALSAVWARHALGGRTGDTLGATVAVAELAVCLSLLAVWQP